MEYSCQYRISCCVLTEMFSIDWRSRYLELVNFFCYIFPVITSDVVLHANMDNAPAFAFCF